MSRGLGKTQRAVLAHLEGTENGTWLADIVWALRGNEGMPGLWDTRTPPPASLVQAVRRAVRSLESRGLVRSGRLPGYVSWHYRLMGHTSRWVWLPTQEPRDDPGCGLPDERRLSSSDIDALILERVRSADVGETWARLLEPLHPMALVLRPTAQQERAWEHKRGAEHAAAGYVSGSWLRRAQDFGGRSELTIERAIERLARLGKLRVVYHKGAILAVAASSNDNEET
jgi:hypothetical protein